MRYTLPTVATEWADWIMRVKRGDAVIPENVTDASALRTADALGCASDQLHSGRPRLLLGSLTDPTMRGSRAVALALAEDSARILDAVDLALLVSAAAHSGDFDDSHLPSLTHPSAPVVGAAYAAGAMFRSSPDEILDAVTIGREVTIRMGLAAHGSLGRTGLNTTTIGGAVGAAAAAAFLRPDASAPLIAAALSIAAGTASGTQEWAATGAENKWLQVGFAASTGLRAAITAVPGLRRPRRPRSRGRQAF